MIRPVEDLEEILHGLAPNLAARRIFGDIYYYSPRRESMRQEDDRQLANALEAWHRLRDEESL